MLSIRFWASRLNLVLKLKLGYRLTSKRRKTPGYGWFVCFSFMGRVAKVIDFSIYDSKIFGDTRPLKISIFYGHSERTDYYIWQITIKISGRDISFKWLNLNAVCKFYILKHISSGITEEFIFLLFKQLIVRFFLSYTYTPSWLLEVVLHIVV